MELWTIWLLFISESLEFLVASLGLSEAVAIIVFTILGRLVLLPISFHAALKMHDNRVAINRIKPALTRLQERFHDDAAELGRRTLALYRKEGVTFFNWTTIANMGTQVTFGLGVFQALRNAPLSAKFLWIADIAKPDALLAVLVGALTFISMLMMPGAPEHGSLVIYLIPALVACFMLAVFPSALGLFWATSNVVTITQAVALNSFVTKRDGPKAPSA